MKQTPDSVDYGRKSSYESCFSPSHMEQEEQGARGARVGDGSEVKWVARESTEEGCVGIGVRCRMRKVAMRGSAREKGCLRRNADRT